MCSFLLLSMHRTMVIDKNIFNVHVHLNKKLIEYLRNMSKKTCPICQEEIDSTDEGWVVSEIPKAQEINEKICAELMELSKSKR